MVRIWQITCFNVFQPAEECVLIRSRRGYSVRRNNQNQAPELEPDISTRAGVRKEERVWERRRNGREKAVREGGTAESRRNRKPEGGEIGM